jgi:hypothetical protein
LLLPLLTVATQLATSTAAQAAVQAGDLVFGRLQLGGVYPYEIVHRASSGGTVTSLSTTGPDSDASPDVSPDGARIAFIGYRPVADNPSVSAWTLMVMNSDGSAQAPLTMHVNTPYTTDSAPAWSPDGQQIAYIYQSSNSTYVHVVNADGTGSDTPLTSAASGGGTEVNVSWSPSGNRLVYDSTNSSTSNQQLYIMDADGSNKHLLAGSDSGYGDSAPTWSPDGNRVYFTSTQGSGIWYYSSSNGFASGSVSRTQLSSSGPAGANISPKVKVSADGNTLVYSTQDGSLCNEIYTISASGGSPTQVTDTDCDYHNIDPTFVPASWPPTPPSNSTVAVSAPSPSDAPYTRQITVGLSATGVQRFEYGWSTSSSTAPNTSYLQTTTDLTNKKGTLNYLGAYSGSGTTWNGGTQPNQNWYLWVRSVQTGGTPNSWGTPLLVHTPKQPVWVGVGDSYSSGHHQTADEPSCAEEAPEPFTCEPSSFTGNDASFSWVTRASDKFNTDQHVPAVWQIQPTVIAASGKPTSDFGNGTYNANASTWARSGQSGRMSLQLYSRYTSWNVVSMTGGANDTPWRDVMRQWYIDNFDNGRVPWNVSSVVYCPDTESVWQSLDSTLTSAITSNLQGIVAVGTAASPGVRVLNVNYPYVVDYGTQSTGNPCYSDWSINGTGYHGVKSVIDVLNSAHTSVTGSNVKNVNINTAFSTTAAVSNGYIQETRIYGYPHPSGGSTGGQAKIADTAVTVLTGSGW